MVHLTPVLTLESGDGRVEEIRLDKEALTLGRSRDCELSFPDDASLSRRHLTIERNEEGVFVNDLGSKNGTRVGGVAVTGRRRLRAGDRITAGHLVLRYDGGTIPPPAGEVVFLADAGPILNSAGTLMTSLEGVLSDSNTLPGANRRKPDSAPGESSLPFASPAVSALVRAGRELAGRRPLAELFPLILDLAISAVGADRGVVFTLENGELVCKASRGEGFHISSAVRDHVLIERASLLVRDTRADEMFRQRASIIEQNVRTMMAAPLQTDERVIGFLYVDSPFFARQFTMDDLSLLTVMANVAAIRIEHQRLAEVEQVERIMSRDLDQAAEIQRMLLPGQAPIVAGMDIAADSAPCRSVGGDYYEFFERPGGRLSAVLGDVSGKGMPAALLMSRLQAKVQVLVDEGADLATAMGRLDRAIALNSPSNRFVTLFWVDLDPATGEFIYCNAGHNPPLVIRADGSVDRLTSGGAVLGLVPGLGYAQDGGTLGPEELLVVFSDGVTEAWDGSEEEFGEERLAATLIENRSRPAAEIHQAVLAAVVKWSAGRPAADDATLMILRRTAG